MKGVVAINHDEDEECIRQTMRGERSCDRASYSMMRTGGLENAAIALDGTVVRTILWR